MYTWYIYTYIMYTYITIVFIVVIIISSILLSILISILKFFFDQFRKEDFYPIKTEDQCKFTRETILHYHDWRKTEIDESDFIKYVKRHSKADKKSGLMI